MSSDDKELLSKLEGNLKLTMVRTMQCIEMVGAIKPARAGYAAKTHWLSLLAGLTGG